MSAGHLAAFRCLLATGGDENVENSERSSSRRSNRHGDHRRCVWRRRASIRVVLLLDEKLNFASTFLARCIAKRAISPLRVGDEVEVIGMAPEQECEREMFVMIRWEREGLAVPLSQLEVIHADDQTREAVEDWRYWVSRGYQF